MWRNNVFVDGTRFQRKIPENFVQLILLKIVSQEKRGETTFLLMAQDFKEKFQRILFKTVSRKV